MNLQLYLFAAVETDPVLRDLLRFRGERDREAGIRACRALLGYGAGSGRRGDLLSQYAIEALLDSPGAGRLAADALSARYLEHDLCAFFDAFFAFDWAAHCAANDLLPFPVRREGDELPAWLWPMVCAETSDALIASVRAFYADYHDRDEARFEAFRWEDGALVGIDRPERQRFESLAGLEHQKAALRENAEAFLDGRPAHNVLLVGSSGTGKSSCVKATLTAYAGRGLRLVELPRQRMGELPRLAEALRDRRQRYIVYIDDLSFEEVDAGYKALKVALEGQVEAKPDHLLLYVTSNRRNLVRETWNDRAGDEEIHQNDSLHEKRSLSERFGLRLHFGILSQKEYLAAVELLLGERGLPCTAEAAAAANTWAMQAGGRSGRCARQFAEDWTARHDNHTIPDAPQTGADRGEPTCK